MIEIYHQLLLERVKNIDLRGDLDRAKTYSRYAENEMDKYETQLRYAGQADDKAAMYLRWAGDALRKQ